MSRKFAIVAALAALALVAGLAAAGSKSEVTVTGDIVCAKCTLQQAEFTECQNVLAVKAEGGEATYYYLAKNKVADDYGHVCKGSKPATVTGTVEEKDGKKWLTASKMMAPEKKG